ncbi:hypothetical protein [Rhizobium oryzicola]|uniref:Uncharacterized protein n=1 Tax=Rhizobium oryzicola TaxID=1232668 RepID=A0ABT8SZR0_9HYPH|nr:hypothetical protein [Rhizobium oryzicola]MDO1583684.1 hypothetical protein [Rhizobium oryzicola]
MSNVIKFERPKPVKPPRQTPPWLRKAAIVAAIIAAFVLAWFYFTITGNSAGLGQ